MQAHVNNRVHHIGEGRFADRTYVVESLPELSIVALPELRGSGLGNPPGVQMGFVVHEEKLSMERGRLMDRYKGMAMGGQVFRTSVISSRLSALDKHLENIKRQLIHGVASEVRSSEVLEGPMMVLSKSVDGFLVGMGRTLYVKAFSIELRESLGTPGGEFFSEVETSWKPFK